jgi:peroxiredoxin
VPTGRALTTAEAPEFTLPDANGLPFTLSSLRGQKVVMVAWASW